MSLEWVKTRMKRPTFLELAFSLIVQGISSSLSNATQQLLNTQTLNCFFFDERYLLRRLNSMLNQIYKLSGKN